MTAQYLKMYSSLLASLKCQVRVTRAHLQLLCLQNMRCVL